MSTKIRAIVVVAVMAVFASLFVGAASAATNGVAVLTGGTASVGKWFSTQCDKNGAAEVEGKGLYFPGTTNVDGVMHGDREEDGVWSIQNLTGTFTGVTQAGPALAAGFTINACGYLGPVVDLTEGRDSIGSDQGVDSGVGGASCGNSKGHHGQGHARLANGEMIKLYDLGWKSSAGGVLPVTGRYQEYANDQGDPNAEGNKKPKYGVIVATINASPASPTACSGLFAVGGQNGAQEFTVRGQADLVNTNGTPVPEPKDTLEPVQPKNCKNQGPQQSPPGPGGKKSHDNKPGTHPCTPEDAGRKTGA